MKTTAKIVNEYLKKGDWRVKENSTVQYSLGGLILSNSGNVTSDYWLNEIYDKEIADAHINADIHIHDLSMLSGYCAGWSLKQLIKEGLGGVPGKITSTPASHLSTLCNQMVNFLGIMQNEWAGAQAFSSFDTYLAPFVKVDNLSYKEVKQCIQSFVYGVNTPSRWGTQAPFTNITLDWVVPNDLAELNCIVGGKEVDFRYKDCKREMDMVNKAFIEVMLEGDANGRGFQYPIPTYSITKDFDWSETENNKLLFEMTAKYGTPYFSNYINSDMEPSDVRSMCPLSGDTQILWFSGSKKRFYNSKIEDLYNDKVEDISLISNGKLIPARVNKFEIPADYRIVLSNDAVIKTTANHLNKVLGKDYVETKDLQVGDYLPASMYLFDYDNLKRSKYGDKYIVQDGYLWFSIKSIDKLKPSSGGATKVSYCMEILSDDEPIFMLANGIYTHNCRLRLDLRELRRKSGGFFGSGESTGSIGVVTINMPRIAYLSNDKSEFYDRLYKLMDISARSLYIKRKAISQWLEEGLYPYTKRYLGTFNNHFSTLGLVGMNEACLNAKWLNCDLSNESAQEFTKEVLNNMREKLSDYQEQYGDLFNLEATPAESTSYRLAKHDVAKYPDIITASNKSEAPYYTNSSHLPVDYTEDIFSALDIQDGMQVLYTSGTVFHTFLGEKLPSWQSAAALVRTIATNYKLPYYTLSPTYSVCAKCGYIPGEHYVCPHCDNTTEVYSRITGYYRPVQNWNTGKLEEFSNRTEYVMPEGLVDGLNEVTEIGVGNAAAAKEVMLFATTTCPNCKMAEKFLDAANVAYTKIYADQEPEKAIEAGVTQAPTLVIKLDDGTYTKITNLSNIRKWIDAQA